MTELFLQPELEEIVVDSDKKAEWEEKIMSLGLEGQLSLTVNSDKNAASPYTFMNNHMKSVFTVLCPTRVAVEKYNKTQIPIDVLSHLALCKQEGYFKKMEVWYDNMHPDPILVGYVSESYSQSIIHIIARWGDEIVPFELLVDKAVRRLTERYTQYLQGVAAKATSMLELAQHKVREYIGGGLSDYQLQVESSFPMANADWSSVNLPF